jgi:hypothetical protein
MIGFQPVVLVDSPDELVIFRDAILPFYAQGMRMQRVLGVFARSGLLRLLGPRIPMLMLPDDPRPDSRPELNLGLFNASLRLQDCVLGTLPVPWRSLKVW